MAEQQGKIALVTGGATGIGAAVARQLTAEGVRVAICDVNATAGEALARELGGKFFPCDVREFSSVKSAVDACVEQLGVPSYAHLNAGIMTVPTGDPFLAIEDVAAEQYRRILGVNLDGVYHGAKALIPLMRTAGGAITLTASTAGLSVLPIDPLYCATKYAVVGFGRSIAAANAATALRINVICPGVVDTGIVPDAFKAPEYGMMPASVMANEIVDLLFRGENGEVRAKNQRRSGGVSRWLRLWARRATDSARGACSRLWAPAPHEAPVGDRVTEHGCNVDHARACSFQRQSDPLAGRQHPLPLAVQGDDAGSAPFDRLIQFNAVVFPYAHGAVVAGGDGGFHVTVAATATLPLRDQLQVRAKGRVLVNGIDESADARHAYGRRIRARQQQRCQPLRREQRASAHKTVARECGIDQRQLPAFAVNVDFDNFRRRQFVGGKHAGGHQACRRARNRGFQQQWKHVVGAGGQGHERCILPAQREGTAGAVATEHNHTAAAGFLERAGGGHRVQGGTLRLDGQRFAAEALANLGQGFAGDAVGVVEVHDLPYASRPGAGQGAPDDGALFLVVEHRGARDKAPHVLAGGRVCQDAEGAPRSHAPEALR